MVVLTACGDGASGGSQPATPAGASVVIRTFQFEPGELTVPAGSTVRWTNEDGTLHTVTSGAPQEQGVPGVKEDRPAEPDGLFDGEVDERGGRFEVTLSEPGEYTYFCRIHAGMVATLRVSPS